jgi:hypothetical protein
MMSDSASKDSGSGTVPPSHVESPQQVSAAVVASKLKPSDSIADWSRSSIASGVKQASTRIVRVLY